MSRPIGWADTAGVLGAVFAALCCAGAPVIVSVISALGLSWLRQDAILWPLMILSLVVALWGLAVDQRRHHRTAPMVIAAGGALALATGVMAVHGPLAPLLINGGAVALVAATTWNIWARRRLCGPEVVPAPSAALPLLRFAERRLWASSKG